MTDINLKTLTPDTSLPTTGFLFGADSQASTNPSVYSTQTVATTLLGSTSLTGDTLTASAPVLNLTQTWSNGAVTFTGMKFNVASDTSAAASLLMDLQVGGTSQFTVKKTGSVSMGARLDAGVGELTVEANRIAARYGDFDINGSGTGVDSAGLFYFSNTASNAIFAFADTFLSRKNTRILQLGAADAATALAQTLSVQSVVAGTSNKAGENFTITGSQGTGTGAGGSIIFQVAPAGGSGTAQNAFVTRLQLNASGAFGATISGDLKVNNNIELTGTNASLYNAAGNLTLGDLSNQYAVTISGATNAGVTLSSAGVLRWTNGTSFGGTADLFLYRDNAGILAQRNGANAQEFRVYETTTGTIYKALLGNRQLMKISGASFTDGAGAQAGTITNSPTAGNPTKWIPIDDNGTTRYIPAW
jgi:hypothetical protein